MLAFFTFFRKSNLFPSSATHLDPQPNLTRSDIQLFPSFGSVSVTWTKTLQYKECRLSIPIPRISHSPLCPVSALENYFQTIPMPNSQPYPLFMFKNGSTLHTLPIITSSTFCSTSYLHLVSIRICIQGTVFVVVELRLLSLCIFLQSLSDSRVIGILMLTYVTWTNLSPNV